MLILAVFVWAIVQLYFEIYVDNSDENQTLEANFVWEWGIAASLPPIVLVVILSSGLNRLYRLNGKGLKNQGIKLK